MDSDFVVGINKSIDAAKGETGQTYPAYLHNTLVTKKLDELAEAITEGGGGASALSDLTDVDISGTVAGGKVLKYNAVEEKWAPGDDSGNIQSDWNESDPTSGAYILNKPDLDFAKSSAIADVYDPSYPSYSVGDYSVYNSKLYKCISTTTGGTFDPECWEECTPMQELDSWGGMLNALSYGVTAATATVPSAYFYNTTNAAAYASPGYSAPGIEKLSSSIYVEYSYFVGDHVIYNGELYSCTTNTGGEFNPSCWASIKIDNIVSTKMDVNNPTGTGTLSINRKKDSTIGTNSTTVGFDNVASGNYSFAEGVYTIASGNYSHAEGRFSTASGIGSHAEGSGASSSSAPTASGDYSHAEGVQTTASGNYSHAEGFTTVASGKYSHSEGKDNEASGNSSHAEGEYTLASGACSHAEGGGTRNAKNTASGDCSHVEGGDNIASEDYSHSEGRSNKSLAECSHTEGYHTTVTSTGNYAHAEGEGTTASGFSSHAECFAVTASGYGSHAEGSNTTASGDYSHAEGSYTTAKGTNQHAGGKYNIIDNNNTYAEIIGNGTADNARSNARTLDWSGNEVLAGTIDASGFGPTLAGLIPSITVDSGTLTAGNTTVTISNAAITANSIIIPCVDEAFTGVAPTAQATAAGSVTLTFPAQSTDMPVKVVVI